jgi:hypothetical protein
MKKKSQANRKRSFFDLTPEERERDVARFDRPIDIDRETRPLSAKERALFERMFAADSTATVHVKNGRRDVVVQIDDQLWDEATAFARRKKTTIPKMIDRGLRGLLAFEE